MQVKRGVEKFQDKKNCGGIWTYVICGIAKNAHQSSSFFWGEAPFPCVHKVCAWTLIEWSIFCFDSGPFLSDTNYTNVERI